MQTNSKQVNNEILEILDTTGTQKRTGNEKVKAYLIASLIIGGLFGIAVTINHLGLLKEV